jgi:hypothetical protein
LLRASFDRLGQRGRRVRLLQKTCQALAGEAADGFHLVEAGGEQDADGGLDDLELAQDLFAG